MAEPFKISTAVISYNQEKFVDQTLNGVVMQTVSGNHEIVCGDDASPDSTRSIIERHQKTDNRISLLAETSNMGMHKNWARTIAACKGEYIAICEGDDVWTDFQKLQKQIDILDKHPEASACFSNANVIDSEGKVGEYLYVDKPFSTLKAQEFFQLNLNPIPTCTVVFRKSAFNGFPSEYYASPFADWILHSILIQKGPFIYLPEVTSSYRQHSGGVWTGIEEEKQLLNKLKALYIIRSIISSEHRVSLNRAVRKQLDKLLYFYRDQKSHLAYFTTWCKLKIHQ